MNTHLHVTAWALGIILFIIVVALRNSGNDKGAKIVHMILRLDFLLILYSGGTLLTNYFSGSSPLMGEAIFKGLAGIWVIFTMEMVANKMARKEATKSWWIQLVIALLITIVLGFGRLPGGFAG